MEELDFSEEACIERYVSYAYFNEDVEDHLHIEGIEADDRIISCLQTYGRIAADWVIYGTKKPDDVEEVMPPLKMAA
ncbi:MAG: hypothetical protein HZB31_04445 [Nitrospirae bacterium]|nr:hypothetical protein [Nitrospirota bacterium]